MGEEVGLSLDEPGAYRFLGCVQERRASSGLVVACRVYEQMKQDIPRHIQAREVAACGWTPLATLLEEDCARPLQWSSRHGGVGVAYDGFPSVLLPMSEL